MIHRKDGVKKVQNVWIMKPDYFNVVPSWLQEKKGFVPEVPETKKEGKMKKIISVAVIAAAVGFAFAEGWKADGYIRTGVEGNSDAKDFETKEYKDGKVYGNGSSRLRMNVNFAQEDYGFRFRYECNKFGLNNADQEKAAKLPVKGGSDSDSNEYVETKSTKETWFAQDNLKYVYGYEKFLDGKVIAEAGKLQDFYTQTEGKQEYSAMSGYGVRGVYVPVDELYLSAAATTYRAEKFKADDDEVKDKKTKEGDLKLNEKVMTLSAKYKTDDFIVAAGHNFAGETYGYFELKSVPNFMLKIEAKYLDKDISKKTDGKGKDAEYTEIWEQAAYNFKDSGLPLEAGLYCGQKIVKDDNVLEFYPYMSYALNGNVSPELEVGIIKYSESKNHLDRDGDEQGMTFNVTPSVKIAAGKKAIVKVYYNYDKNDKHAVGTTMKVSF